MNGMDITHGIEITRSNMEHTDLESWVYVEHVIEVLGHGMTDDVYMMVAQWNMGLVTVTEVRDTVTRDVWAAMMTVDAYDGYIDEGYIVTIV